MPEVPEESKMGRSDIERLFGVVRRRHLHFLIPLFLAWLAVWGASWILPPRYKSSTLILVEQPSISDNYVTPNVSDDWQARLQSITQQILSRTRLLMIINNLHLYGNMQNTATLDDKIDQMRKDIDVEIERDPGRADISAFRINYSASDPQVAQQVAGELSNLFISENSRVRQELSQGTTDFMEQQLEDARQSLAAQEAKVQEFEGQHEGALPDQQASNLQIMDGLEAQLQNEQDALNTAKQQRTYLEAMLAQERAGRSSGHLTGADGRGISSPADLATIDDQLDKLRAQYADLSSRYTDSYPDVQSLKHQIAHLEATRENLVAAAKAKSKEPKQPDEGSNDSDPTLSGPALQTQSELQANQMEISNREKAIVDLKSRIGGYEGRLNAEPSTAQQLTDLTRGYDQSKANYDELLKKKDDSAMATSMEKLQQGERFTVLDAPTLPTAPDFPNRLKFCALGLGAGIALGFVVALAFEFLDDRIYNGKEIKALLPMAIISEVPECVNPIDERNTKRRLVLGWVTTAFVATAILAGSIVSFIAAPPKT
jgi:succinoglycan biosynthesis transport protein ExoP